MNRLRSIQLLFFVLLLVLNACQSAKQPSKIEMLRQGDTIDGMKLTTGAAHALPLDAFCSPARENQHVTKTDCFIPALLDKVAIGPVFNIVGENTTQPDSSDFTWALMVDEQAIDLASFGKYKFPMPTQSPSPSPVREVFKISTIWDIVLTDLKPGVHILNGLAQSETESHSWIVNLRIEAPYASDFGSQP